MQIYDADWNQLSKSFFKVLKFRLHWIKLFSLQFYKCTYYSETTKICIAAMNLVCNTKRYKNGSNGNRSWRKYLFYRETRHPTQRCVLLLLSDLTFRSKWKSWVCIMRSASFAFSNGTTGEAMKPFDRLHINLRSSYKSAHSFIVLQIIISGSFIFSFGLKVSNNLFDIQRNVHSDKILIIKPTRCTNFSNLFLE